MAVRAWCWPTRRTAGRAGAGRRRRRIAACERGDADRSRPPAWPWKKARCWPCPRRRRPWRWKWPPMPPMPGAPAQPATPIAVRTDFNPLALFAPAVRTDADGTAHRGVQAARQPDALPRHGGGRRPTSSSARPRANMTARLPLMVRPSAPRFLNFGDRFELPVVLQNQTDAPLTVDVVAEAANLTLDGGQRASASTVPANDRVEVRFPAADGQRRHGARPDRRGRRRLCRRRHGRAAGLHAGHDRGLRHLRRGRRGRDRPARCRSRRMSSRSSAGWRSAPRPRRCRRSPTPCSTCKPIPSSAPSSSPRAIMSVAALRDVLTAFQAEGLPSPSSDRGGHAARHRDAAAAAELGRRLARTGPRATSRCRTTRIFVTHALQWRPRQGLRRAAGDARRARWTTCATSRATIPSWYSAKTRQTLSAYALYVRALMGDVDTAKARSVYDAAAAGGAVAGGAWPGCGRCWPATRPRPTAWPPSHGTSHNRAVETPGTANFITSYGDQEYVMLHSNRRTDAVILDALIVRRRRRAT